MDNTAFHFRLLEIQHTIFRWGSFKPAKTLLLGAVFLEFHGNAAESPSACIETAERFNQAVTTVPAPKLSASDALAQLQSAMTEYLQSIEDGAVETSPQNIAEHVRTISSVNQAFSQASKLYSARSTEKLLEVISHPEAPTIGNDFISRLKQSGLTYNFYEDDAKDADLALFSAYHLKRGRVNELAVNVAKIDLDRPHLTMSSFNHERFHALTSFVSDVYEHNAWNRKTRLLIHPYDKMVFDNLCERDAHTKQALINVLAMHSRSDDTEFCKAMRRDTRFNVLSTLEMERLMKSDEPLQEILICAALQSMDKLYTKDVPGFTFTHSYYNSTLRDFRNGLLGRHGVNTVAKITDPIPFQYFRLTPEDFYGLSLYGVGPSSLGGTKIDPRFSLEVDFASPIANTPDIRAKYEALCKDFGIPERESCPTFTEILESQKQQKAERSFNDRSASSFASAPSAQYA